MRSRTIITALFAVLVMASSAMAGEVELVISTPSVDTSDFVGLDDADEVNDTIVFTGSTFGYSGDYDVITGILVQSANSDTATETGTAFDSVYFKFQTKYDNANDSAWHTLHTTTLAKVDDFNSLGWDVRQFTVPVDSLVSVGNLFRLMTYWIAETDSFQAEANRNGSTSDSCCVDWGATFEADILFR